jgi:hypothetical protein
VGRTLKVRAPDNQGHRGFYKQIWKSAAESGSWQGAVLHRHQQRGGAGFVGAGQPPSGTAGPRRFFWPPWWRWKGTGVNKEKLVHLAHHDPLTGLPNRVLFYDRLKLALAQAKRRKKGLALMFLDIDNFKTINDSLSHAVGDEYLQGCGLPPGLLHA